MQLFFPLWFGYMLGMNLERREKMSDICINCDHEKQSEKGLWCDQPIKTVSINDENEVVKCDHYE